LPGARYSTSEPPLTAISSGRELAYMREAFRGSSSSVG
jgi:hypothetical protein